MSDIHCVTVMKETGLIVVSTLDRTLFQISLQEGRLIKKYIKCPCEHHACLLCVEVAGREYLAVSCKWCETIKLMNLNKQKRSSSESQLIQYKLKTAFRGDKVDHMVHGEENRLFIDAGGVVLELDTSDTPFTKVRTIRSDEDLCALCYVPDPHRLLVVSGHYKVCAVSRDNNNIVWTTEYRRHFLYIPSYDVILAVNVNVNVNVNVIAVLNPETGSELQSICLPDSVRNIRGLCLFKNQIIVACDAWGGNISYFNLK